MRLVPARLAGAYTRLSIPHHKVYRYSTHFQVLRAPPLLVTYIRAADTSAPPSPSTHVLVFVFVRLHALMPSSL